MSPLFAAVRRAALLWVPFAAIFVAGVTLSPHADAQYPGGGSRSGYPGGPAPGWHPVKPDGTLGNDVLNTDANFSVYDSTRLDVLRTGTNRTGSSSSTPASTPPAPPATTPG